jgi:hypothetical protein
MGVVARASGGRVGMYMGVRATLLSECGASGSATREHASPVREDKGGGAITYSVLGDFRANQLVGVLIYEVP